MNKCDKCGNIIIGKGYAVVDIDIVQQSYSPQDRFNNNLPHGYLHQECYDDLLGVRVPQ